MAPSQLRAAAEIVLTSCGRTREWNPRAGRDPTGGEVLVLSQARSESDHEPRERAERGSVVRGSARTSVAPARTPAPPHAERSRPHERFPRNGQLTARAGATTSRPR